MAAAVNLDALIPREDFAVQGSGDEAPVHQTIQVRDLEKASFFFGAIRKPDFQRETSEWAPDRVVGLIRTFIEGELIPAVILWKNRELLFVIDGSHRLSALTAWVQDDYGDGDVSRTFFDNIIPDEQIKAAKSTRELVEKTIGSYANYKKAIENPENFGPDVVARSRRLGSLALQLQWVRGDAHKAEDSFVRINQQAAMIKPPELELIKSRKKPGAIAARAILRRGTGHKYWSQFSAEIQASIQEIASDIHQMMFEPNLSYPLKTLDLPAGGSVYSGTALRMVYDFVALSVGTTDPADDEQGQRTLDYLTRTRRVMRLLLSNHASSMGLHPAIYYYSWTGKQQPILFLVVSALLVQMERDKQLDAFTRVRAKFEEFLVSNRSLLNQVIRKFGTKDSGGKHLTGFYRFVLAEIERGSSAEGVISALTAAREFSYVQPAESAYEGAPAAKFSSQVKSGVVLAQLLPTALRCKICGGYVPSQAISIDHVDRRSAGGSSAASNAAVTHPYCNTTFKR